MLHPGLRVSIVPGGVISSVLIDRRAKEAKREGLHCSTIVNDMMQTMYPKKYDDEESGIDEAQRVTLYEFGNAYEDIIASRLRRRLAQWEKPVPREHQGIICSPDGWTDETKTLDEIKTTWVSRKDFAESVKFLSYLYQALPYAHVWGATRVRFHILFVVANYRSGSPLPYPMTVIVRWPDDDVPRQYFRMLRQHARDRGWL